MDWSFVAKKAFNIYFEDFLENKDHSIAQNSTNKLIKLFATKAGFKFIDLSSNKIPKKHLIVFFTQFADTMCHIEVDKNFIDNGEFLWPMHSWLSNHCYKNLKKHGKSNFESIQRYIDEDLTDKLPD